MSILNRFKKKTEAPEKASVATRLAEKDAAAAKKTVKKAASNKEKTTQKKSITSVSKLATSTLLAPVVSEKTAKLSDEGVVSFFVAPGANRVAVRQAFRELYKITPVKVNIINVRGKAVRFGRVQGKRNNMKKAHIFLPKGTRVDIFEGV
ncbi:MAG: 50S ribosomal protein L23 [Patescibacteria group bacterium]|nr:50S ribosomal protein L23 [Patescibacteria group bacterium]